MAIVYTGGMTLNETTQRQAEQDDRRARGGGRAEDRDEERPRHHLRGDVALRCAREVAGRYAEVI